MKIDILTKLWYNFVGVSNFTSTSKQNGTNVGSNYSNSAFLEAILVIAKFTVAQIKPTECQLHQKLFLN